MLSGALYTVYVGKWVCYWKIENTTKADCPLELGQLWRSYGRINIEETYRACEQYWSKIAQEKCMYQQA